MDPNEVFKSEVARNIERLGSHHEIKQKSIEWIGDITALRYVYNFQWLGRPIIQVPQDMVALQELIWAIKPDLVIETGIAHGGSLILSASMLALLDYCDAIENGQTLEPRATRRRVLGVDIGIRAHNRAAIEAHPMAHRIDMIQGSSVATEVVAQVHEIGMEGHGLDVPDAGPLYGATFFLGEAFAGFTRFAEHLIQRVQRFQ